MSKIAKVFSRSFTKYEDAEEWLKLLSSSYEEDEYKFIQHEIHQERTGFLNMSYSGGNSVFQYKAIFRYG
jgi:hypothetical protein